MSQLDLEIHFHAQDVVSVLITSAVSAGDDEDAALLALFALVAARQIANLGSQPPGAWLAAALAAVTPEALPALADRDIPDGPSLRPYQGAPGRVRFRASLSLESFRFRLDAKGMGLFAKGSGYYAPHSVLALLRHLAGRHRDNKPFLHGLAVAAGLLGAHANRGGITVANQSQIALVAWKAALAGMQAPAAAAPESGNSTRLNDQDYGETLRTIYYGGCRFIAAAAQYALNEAAEAAEAAGAGPLGRIVADLGAAARLTAKRMPVHVDHFSEKLAAVMGSVGRRDIGDPAAQLLGPAATITSNEQLRELFGAIVTPVGDLLELCDAAGRKGAVPCLNTYVDLWSIDVPKLDEPPGAAIPISERQPLAAALRCLVSLTEAAAALAILAHAYDLIDREVPSDLVSTGELLQENVAALLEFLDDHYDEDLDDTYADPILAARLGGGHLNLLLFQPLFRRAGTPDTKEPYDVVTELKQHKAMLAEGAALLGEVHPGAEQAPAAPLQVESGETDGGNSPTLTPWVTGTPTGPVDDLGPVLLDRIRQEFQIDDDWSVRQDRTLTWWSHRLAQRIEAEEPRLSLGDATTAVRAVTTVVTDVAADDETIRAALLILNRVATFGAFVYDADHRTVVHSTTGYFHSGNASVQKVFSFATILGNYEAHGRADGLAALLGGRPADAAHPVNGGRSLPDGMLLLGEDAKRVGQEPSHFVGPILGALPESPYVPWVMANGDDEALTGEFAFHHGVPAMVAAMTGRPPGTALVQISTGAEHPAFGNGAIMLMRLPLHVDEDEAAELACGLNRAEAKEWTGFPQWGAWTTTPSSPGTLTHVTFLPNYAAVLGLFPIVAFYQSLRCAWAADRLVAP